MHPGYPNEVLIIYDGDIEAVNKHYVNGNSKSETEKNKRFFPTVPSVLAEAKERKNEPPAKVHLDIINKAPQEIKIPKVRVISNKFITPRKQLAEQI